MPERKTPQPDTDSTTEIAPLKLFTVRETAALLGVSRETVFALLRSGELGSVLIGQRGRRINRAQLSAYLRRLEDERPQHPHSA